MKKATNSFKKILLVDYENLPNIDLSKLKGTHYQVYIFVGRNQHKIPIETVVQMQRMGTDAEWIQISGAGKNNLDFHLCLFLGMLHEKKNKTDQFFVVSADKGFDNTIAFLNEEGRTCYRIEKVAQVNDPENIPNLEIPKKPKPVSAQLEEVLSDLRKMKHQARPRRLRTFKNFLTANFKFIKPEKVEETIQQLRMSGRVYEEHGKMVYRL